MKLVFSILSIEELFGIEELFDNRSVCSKLVGEVVNEECVATMMLRMMAIMKLFLK